MAQLILTPLDRQIKRVSRRMYWQSFLDCLFWCLAGALLLSAVWPLAEPMLLNSAPDWLRFAVTGGLILVGTGLAVLLASRSVPSRVAAALLIDERFDLRERVTTLVSLGDGQESSPAAQALRQDVDQRIDKLDIGSRFPVKVRWQGLLAQMVAGGLAIAAFFYQPTPIEAKVAQADDPKLPPANAKAVDEKMKALKKREDKPRETARSSKAEQLEAKLEEIANKPHKTKEELRDRLKEMTALEETLKTRERDLAGQNAALKQQLKQLDRMSAMEAKEGPAKSLQKSLAEGDYDKAKNELDKLAKKIGDDKLNEQEKKDLSRQLKDMENELNRQADLKDKEEKLEKLQKEGKLDAEALNREKKELDREKEKLKSMKDLADKLGKAQQSLEKGDTEGAQKGLEQAKEQMQDMDINDKDLEDVRDQLQRLQDAKDCAGRNCQGEKEGQGKDGQDKDGQGKDGQGNGQGDTDQPNDGGQAAGRRPVGPDQKTGSYDTRGKTVMDTKGKKILENYVPGQAFKKKSTAEMAGEIEQASQEAPDAIEQQRIPKAAREMAKGYFRTIGGQGEPAKTPEKP